VAWVFDRLGPFLVLLAAMFTIAWLHRSNEMTALFAAGVSPRRIAKPLVTAALAIVLIGLANREWVIPAWRDELSRNAQDWLGDRSRPLAPRYDNRAGLLLNGQAVYPGEQRIVFPQFTFESPQGDFGRRLSAESGRYLRSEGPRPAGYLLTKVADPKQIAELPSLVVGGKPVVLTPRDYSWLEKDECFVVSAVDFEQLTGGAGWRQFSSTRQLIAGLRNPSLDFGADVRVEIHSRMVRPFLDLSLVLLGLPVAFAADQRNIFLAAGKGVLLALGFLLVVLACQGLGGQYLIRPALAAWAPLLIFVPLGVYLNEPLRK
jgi:lipopolysaccharide export system permease protein